MATIEEIMRLEGCDIAKAMRIKKNEDAAAKRAAKKIDQRIERIYYARCNGVQIDIMDIGKVFKTGQSAIADNAEIDDQALGDKIVEFVQTIRKN